MRRLQPLRKMIRLSGGRNGLLLTVRVIEPPSRFLALAVRTPRVQFKLRCSDADYSPRDGGRIR